MPTEVLSDKQHMGLLGLRVLLENDDDSGNWLSRGKSGCCGSRNFFLGGENGDN